MMSQLKLRKRTVHADHGAAQIQNCIPVGLCVREKLLDVTPTPCSASVLVET